MRTDTEELKRLVQTQVINGFSYAYARMLLDDLQKILKKALAYKEKYNSEFVDPATPRERKGEIHAELQEIGRSAHPTVMLLNHHLKVFAGMEIFREYGMTHPFEGYFIKSGETPLDRSVETAEQILEIFE
jgi:hypothetical protein